MNGKKGNMFRIFTNTLAFSVLIVITILMVVSKFTSSATNFSAVCGEIVKYLALVVVCLASFWYVMSKRSKILKVVWVLCVGAVVVFAVI